MREICTTFFIENLTSNSPSDDDDQVTLVLIWVKGLLLHSLCEYGYGAILQELQEKRHSLPDGSTCVPVRLLENPQGGG